MTDIESKLRASMNAVTDHPVMVDGLAQGAMRRARRIRARRWGAAAAVAIVAGAGLATLPDRPQTTLPAAGGVAAAASRPESIGSDPRFLHFDADLFELPGVATVEFVAGDDHEAVNAYSAADTLVASVFLAPSEADLRGILRRQQSPASAEVEGRPATAEQFRADDGSGEWWDLRWQPRDGIHAAVIANGPDLGFARQVFSHVRLDVAQRCATPMRLLAVPPGATWNECLTALRDGKWLRSGLQLQEAEGNRLIVWATRAGAEGQPGGRTAQWLTDQRRGLWLPDTGPLDVFIYEREIFRVDLLDEAEARWIADHLEVTDDLTDPADWPPHKDLP